MSDQPTGEWTVERLLSYCNQNYEYGLSKAAIAINAEFSAEREKVTLATQMVQIESKRANEAEQKVQVLVDALKDIRAGPPDIVKQQTGRRACQDWSEMSDQPTGEWTYVPGAANPGRSSFGKIVCAKVTICEHIEGELYGRQIADAHNSELAAEQDKREQIEIAIADLSHPNCQMLLRKERQLREQFAAELERVQTLVELAHFFKSVILSGDSWTQTCQKQYDAVLAKVKEGK